MGVQIALYNACTEYNTGIFQISVPSSCTFNEGSGDICGDCGTFIQCSNSSGSPQGFTETITVPFANLIYNPQNVWIVVTGTSSITSGTLGLYDKASVTFVFLNESGSEIGSFSTPQVTVGNNFMAFAPIPQGTYTIQIQANLSVSNGNTDEIGIANIAFFSQPIEYYIEPLFFYNQSLTYSISLSLSESGYVGIMSMSGGPSNLQSYSACVNTSAGSVCATNIVPTSISSINEFYVTGNANSSYQITWSQVVAVTYLTSSCGVYQILVFNITGYNNILNPLLQQFTVQTPFNGTISKNYTLLVPAGYFKLLPSYSLSCSTSPCTNGFTTFTVTIDIETSSGVIIASQQVNILQNEQFVEFNLEDYYQNQTLDVIITLDINATLSQNVTLTMNFEYEVQPIA